MKLIMKLYEKPVARSVEMHIKTKCAYYDTTRRRSSVDEGEEGWDDTKENVIAVQFVPLGHIVCRAMKYLAGRDEGRLCN